MTSSPLLDSLVDSLTPDQQLVLDQIKPPTTCIEGPAGTGKTRVAVTHLLQLVDQGVPAESILVLVPQRSLAGPYYQVTQSADFSSGGKPAILTVGGLAQRTISLFWPLISKQAGFRYPKKEPRFLTVETAQYYLSNILSPLLEQGYFQNLTIDQNRLSSQIIDNLNKSSVVGFPLDQLADRLDSAWGGKEPRRITYEQAQECAILFRMLCLENNLLDFSLQLSVFSRHLWPSMICREYLHKNYTHLIYDNVEEDYPIAHDLIKEWLPALDSALMIQDSDAGFRTFLGADPASASDLGLQIAHRLELSRSLVQSPGINELEKGLNQSILDHKVYEPQSDLLKDAFSTHSFRFYTEAIQWVTQKINELLKDDQTKPGEIAILSPYLSDSLRFSFSMQLEKAGIPFMTFHPYRGLKDEPIIQSLLTLIKLANPEWESRPTQQDVRSAFIQTLGECDIVRADLLAQVLFKPRQVTPWLNPFANLNGDMQTRITYLFGEKYEILRTWLLENPLSQDGIDHWSSRLFGEILSQPGFGLQDDFKSAALIARFNDSYRKFRMVVEPVDNKSENEINKEFIATLESGTLAAQSIEAVRTQTGLDAVILAPAYTFLVNNKTVKYQFWMDAGSQGWWSRLDQPLTQPFVLSRNWNADEKWTDLHEYAANQKMMNRLTTGLLRRCNRHVFLSTVNFNEQGLEEKGALLLAFQNILRAIKTGSGADHV